jgi:hypothetical protein
MVNREPDWNNDNQTNHADHKANVSAANERKHPDTSLHNGRRSGILGFWTISNYRKRVYAADYIQPQQPF